MKNIFVYRCYKLIFIIVSVIMLQNCKTKDNNVSPVVNNVPRSLYGVWSFVNFSDTGNYFGKSVDEHTFFTYDSIHRIIDYKKVDYNIIFDSSKWHIDSFMLVVDSGGRFKVHESYSHSYSNFPAYNVDYINIGNWTFARYNNDSFVSLPSNGLFDSLVARNSFNIKSLDGNYLVLSSTGFQTYFQDSTEIDTVTENIIFTFKRS